MADVIGRGQNVAQMSLIVVLQFLERLFPGPHVQLEIGLERGLDAVLLFFYDLVVFVDGEVEGSHQLPVLQMCIRDRCETGSASADRFQLYDSLRRLVHLEECQ